MPSHPPSEPPGEATLPGRAPVAGTQPASTRVTFGEASWDPSTLPVDHEQRYRIVREIGRGGLGRVLEAHDRRLDRPVALKELLRSSPEAMVRFVREARITARLQHPSIVPIHDAARSGGGQPFYAMKRVHGRPLDKLLKAARTLDDRLALLPNLIAVAEAIAYAHSEGVVHRDLKPANLLVGEYGETMVIDWGLAKDLRAAVEARGDAPVDREGLVTSDGAIMGTPMYMP